MSQVATGRRLVAVALVVLSGCNPAFGIDSTILIDAAPIGIDAEDVDLDDDFVLDVVDNCDAIPNPMQEDQDDDDIGDACDPCPAGSNHNEDGDALLDGCDNCPQVANADQANTDADDFGDVCDPNSEEHDTRQRFDGFDQLRVDWIPGGVEWIAESDSIHMLTMPSGIDHGLWNRRVGASGNRWMIETRIVFQPPFTTDDYGAIQSRDSIGMPDFQCYVQYDPPNWIAAGQSATATPITLAADNGVRVRMYYTGTQVMCDFNGVTSPNTAVAPPFTLTHPGLTANTTRAHFQYVDTSSLVP